MYLEFYKLSLIPKKSIPIIHSTNRIRAKAKESSQWKEKRHLIKFNISSLQKHTQ